MNSSNCKFCWNAITRFLFSRSKSYQDRMLHRQLLDQPTENFDKQHMQFSQFKKIEKNNNNKPFNSWNFMYNHHLLSPACREKIYLVCECRPVLRVFVYVQAIVRKPIYITLSFYTMCGSVFDDTSAAPYKLYWGKEAKKTEWMMLISLTVNFYQFSHLKQLSGSLLFMCITVLNNILMIYIWKKTKDI